MTDDRLYFRQLLAGRDFAAADPVAQQMVNFVYLIGDRTTGEAVAVDPAYGVAELIELLGADGMQLTGVLATHYHPDHQGGNLTVGPDATVISTDYTRARTIDMHRSRRPTERRIKRAIERLGDRVWRQCRGPSRDRRQQFHDAQRHRSQH